MKIPHPLVILAWVIFFVAVLLVAADVMSWDLETFPDIPEKTLLHFENRFEKFKKADSPQAVIIGPSYALAFDNQIPGIANLAISGGRGEEIQATLKEVPQADLVIYLFTIHDVSWAQKSPRIEYLSQDARRVSITRSRGRARLGFAPENPRDFFEIEYTPDIQGCMQLAADFSNLPNLHYPVARSLWLYHETEASITLFQECQRIHPNILFIAHPVAPIHSVHDNSQFSVHLNHVLEAQSTVISLMQESNLPFVDLSCQLPLSDFVDFVHLTPSGRDKVKARLATTTNLELSSQPTAK
jgi:hypothetical protein